MKQSAAKSLGVAALGAAFAAAGAGAANAAPAVPDTARTLETVTQALPAEQLSQVVPGSGEALGQGQTLAGTGLAAAQPAGEQVLAQGPAGPAGQLLGGLPTKGLPTKGLPTKGLPAV
ncbi:ATP-binding protein [Streptomyces tuirus]|uniref:ATP-binding protein n=1 Tax=Streptomyces tuirus TaxID=68278 RepID=A0A941J1K1_9ACTN|nr:ATP-binding protein [Streptomyces tuirus]